MVLEAQAVCSIIEIFIQRNSKYDFALLLSS